MQLVRLEVTTASFLHNEAGSDTRTASLSYAERPDYLPDCIAKRKQCYFALHIASLSHPRRIHKISLQFITF